MKGYKFYIEDKMRFCFGSSRGRIKETFSSDQLYSAIINNIAILYSRDKLEESINYIFDKILFSSMFYGIDIIDKSQNSTIKTIYFLPKPEGSIEYKDNQQLNKQLEEDTMLMRKKIKEVSYLSIDAFKNVINSWDKDEKYFNYNLFKLKYLGEKFACTLEELQDLRDLKNITGSLKFINTNTRQRVIVGRKNDQSEDTYFINDLEIIHMETEKYKIKPFMYFLYDGQLTEEIKASIHILCDEGIGGKRSIGMGFFKKTEQINVPLLEEEEYERNGFISLSTYYPSKEEVDNLTFFQLENRDGYIYSKGGQSLRKQKIRIVKEGSVFSSKVKGQVVDVTPVNSNLDHNVYLNGRVLLFPLGGA